MPPSNICWGIEVGAAAIKAVKIEYDGQRVNILDFARIQHPKVLSTPGVEKSDVLRVSLGQLVSQFDLSKASIAVSVPGHSSFARFAKLPPVEPKKVPDIVKFEAMQQIPFPLEQVEWDFQTFVSPDSPDVEVGIFAITKDRIQEQLQMLGDVGITPDVVTLSPIAVFNALAFDLEFTDKTEGTIMVDVGTTSTDLVVAEAGRVWVRTFPLGGHQFTDALTQQFQITYPKAEKLKQEAEEPKHARQVFQAMRPVFTDLGQDIQRSVGYYQSLHREANLARVIGLGSTFQLPGLRKYLKQQLSMEVYRIEGFKRVNTDTLDGGKAGGPRAEEFNAHAIEFVTALGLALQGVGQGAIGANLMPVELIRANMWKGKVKWFGLAAAVAAIAGAAMFIRPLIDYTNVAAKPEPGEIGEVIRIGSQLKSEAEEKGVLGAAQADLRPANMLALLEHREVFAHVVNDLGLMLESANTRAATWGEDVSNDPAVVEESLKAGGFRLDSMSTQYLPPSAAADPSAEAAPPPEDYGRGGRGGRGGGRDGGGFDSGGSTSPLDTGHAVGDATKPRVLVRMEVSTNQPDHQRFMIDTLQKWLKDNAKRTGVPYEIAIVGSPWAVIGERAVAGGEATPGEFGGDGMDGGFGDGGAPRGMPGRDGFRPRGGRGARDGGMMGDGAPAASEGSADVNQIAPLTSLKPAPVKLPEAKFELYWTAVLVEPGQAAPEAPQ